MQEQRINSTHIDSEYIDTFNRLTETTIGELEHAKQIARGNHALSPTEKAKTEQETTIKAIQSKTSEYEARTQSAYSLYGHNPFFLMKELSFRKILESLETSPPDVSAAYTAIDNTYRSALELKRISLQMNILAKQLEALSLRRGQADTGLQAANNISASRADERFTVINQEVNIRFQLLPFFLVEKIATTTGSARGFTLSQSLSHYKAAIDNIIVIEQAAISPYAKANPNINPPLSKPELEALKNLVNLQATTNLGNRWNDYHVSLLHSETVQYLTQATNAFGGLITRSQEAERLQEQSRIASEAQARHLAEQQAQEGARRHAEAQLHAKQQEAKAAAEARAKIAADKIRVYKAEKRAERIRNQQVATRLAERFTEILENFNQYQPKGIDQKLQWMKEKQDELLSADLNADKAEEKAGMFFGSLKRSQRKTSLQKVQTQIDAVARTIENISLSTVSGAAASSRALVITPDGLIAGYEGFPISLAGAIDSLSNARAAIGGGPLAVLAATLFYTPTLGNGELQRNPVVLTIPLAQLVGDDDYYADLHLYSSVYMPFRVVSSVRGAHTQLYLSPTGEHLPDMVRIRDVELDPLTNLFTFTTEGIPSRTLTWTPNNAPGNDTLGSTELPVDQPEIKIYPGARVTQVEGRTDEHPMCDEADTDDYILIFPEESGIDPVYVMASRSGPRYEPGVVSGNGQEINGPWLRDASRYEGAQIPTQIADRLNGQQFLDFDKFRSAFWLAVGGAPELLEQFSKSNAVNIAKGYSPFPIPEEQVGGRDQFEIHHVVPISEGGAVYDVDNLRILTPRRHIEIHSRQGDRQDGL